MRRILLATAMFMAMVAVPAVGVPAPAAAGSVTGPDRYIVVLKDGNDPGQAAEDHARRLGANVRHVFRSALHGYAARVPADRLAKLRADPGVAYVEPDGPAFVVGGAPGVAITGLKVLDCAGGGSMSDVIAAVDWVTAAARKPAVANLSLGGGVSQVLDDAVRRSAASGVLYVVAAGNNGTDACASSPSRAGAGTNNGIITVAATDTSNREASFSNYGPCVDLWAPGVNILSTSNTGGTATMSGTSMAAPHVAGAGALYLSRNVSASPASTEAVLKNTAAAPPTQSGDGRAIKLVYAGWF